jgi:hypothetical protein
MPPTLRHELANIIQTLRFARDELARVTHEELMQALQDHLDRLKKMEGDTI